MIEVICAKCGRRYRLRRRPRSNEVAKTCVCGHPMEFPRTLAQRLGDSLLYGLGFSLVSVLLPLIRFFDVRYRYSFSKQAFLGLISTTPKFAIAAFAIGMVFGWFSHGWALRVFDWVTEKPRD